LSTTREKHKIMADISKNNLVLDL